MRRLLPELILLIIVVNIAAYTPCGVVQFQDYSFDLRGLRNVTIGTGQQLTYFGVINACSPKACSQSPDAQKSFILRTGNNTCQPYTINATIFENFNYINQQSPKDGISISYLPYITTVVDSSGVTQTTYSAKLNVYCSSTTSVPQSCTYDQTVVNKTKFVDGTNFTRIQSSITCSMRQTNGCPYLTINNFWQFLSNNSIWFAIILWVFSIFELFMGYFVIRLTIFLYGILTGAVFGIIFSAQNYVDFFYDDTGNGIIIFVILISFLMGVLFGLVLLTLPRIGYVNIGIWDAIIFSLLMQNSILYITGSMTAFYITLGVCCLIMFAISLLRFRKFIILSTPFISAFWIVRTLGFVLPYYPNQFASEKLFAINASTPWQFYLYLASIIVLSILGCTFQFCWYKQKGRDHGNKGYYLEDDDNIKDKLKKFLQFNDIKNVINAGKQQMMFLKQLVIDRDSQQSKLEQKTQKKPEIQMVKMSKLKQQKQKTNSSGKKDKINSQVQIEYNKKLKKVDSSDSDGRSQRMAKINRNKNSSNESKVKKKQSQKQQNDSQNSSDEQQQVKKVQAKNKKYRK